MNVALRRYFFTELEREMFETQLLQREPQMADSIFDLDDAELLNRLQ
ncbi:hypothetical protein LRR81_18450 [Metabacillus sp. GX 13764]|nr:hypothetical protein [Metabacillus kandeliae]MCD7036228.1 hypothetical protein [Metabacillus kandeliae]